MCPIYNRYCAYNICHRGGDCNDSWILFNKTHNDNQVAAICIATAHVIDIGWCDEDEDEYCYLGVVYVNITNVVVSAHIRVAYSDSESFIVYYLNEHYPIDGSINCYYDQRDHVAISLKLKDEQGVLITGIVFTSIAGAALLTWLTFEGIWIVMRISYSLDQKKQDIISNTPMCGKCNNRRVNNNGSPLRPVYTNVCDTCNETTMALHDFMKGQDKRFAETFAETVIEMSELN